MKTIGLIINPIAGMGGRVGLKGTDGVEILEKAIELGARKEAPSKALKALEKLLPIKDDLLVLTVTGDMGENQCRALGFNYKLVHRSNEASNSSDTLLAAKLMEKEGVDLIFFVGGDGTARDIFTAVETRVAALGVPGGVKIHSPVYGNTPELAGEVALEYLKDGNVHLREEEVIDLDEEAFRNNQVRTRFFGYLKVPYKSRMMQNKKAPTPLTEEENKKAIALDIVDNMKEGVYYLIGPGSTTRSIMEELDLENSLLGVDIIKDKSLVKLDCNEKEILEIIGRDPAKLIITPTGGQGYLLGRGNQQISPEVIERIGKSNIVIISTQSKIIELGGKPLLVYTGDETVDKMLAGYYRVKIGYGRDMMHRVSNGY